MTSMSVSRALNNHGLALRQRAMLMTDSETEESTESKSKCLSEAILKFRRAIRISPDFHRAAYNLGTVEFARGQMERAAVYVFSALAMVTSALPSSSETENAKVVYSQSAQLVETALPDTQCGDDSLFAGNVWFAGGVGGKRGGEVANKRRTTITDFDWARRRFAVCASAFKTVDSAQTFRIKSNPEITCLHETTRGVTMRLRILISTSISPCFPSSRANRFRTSRVRQTVSLSSSPSEMIWNTQKKKKTMISILHMRSSVTTASPAKPNPSETFGWTRSR